MRRVIIIICILTLTICIGYLPMISSIQKGISGMHGGALLLAAEDEADKAKGDQGDEKKDEVPGIDRIAASVCYG
jgi:hypothetical protein